MKYSNKLIWFILFSFLFNLLIPKKIYSFDETYDLVIQNGNIYNPSTNSKLVNYNLGIKNNKITRITQDSIKGKYNINARNMVVSPGFIDLISYDPNPHGIKFKVLDGVTSNIAMHGGTENAKEWYDYWEKEKVITNFGASSFITRLRWPIVGGGVDAELKDEKEVNLLIKNVANNIENGALGISFSFEYVPGIKKEIIPLLELAKKYNAPTFYHLRYSSKEKELEGVKEVIKYGKETQAPIHIMHLNSTGGTYNMDKALELINSARNKGLDITSCIYPYDFWATYIDSARFRDGWQNRFNITYEDLQIGGSDTRISKENFHNYRKKHLLVAAHNSIPEKSNVLALKDPNVMIGSDTIIEEGGNNHPRGSGTYARVFGKYVREDKTISLMDGIKKTSYLPAKRLENIAPKMKYKGRLEIGADADITIFNPDTIIDNSNVKETEKPSTGIEYVIINGQIVKDKEGLRKNIYPGQAIKSYFVDNIEKNTAYTQNLILNSTSKEIKNIYFLNKSKYFPIEETFKSLNNKVNIKDNGQILIDDFIELKLGSKNLKIKEKNINLKKEPIIYKSNLYIEENSLIQILEQIYNTNIDSNKIYLESRTNLLEKSNNYLKIFILLLLLALASIKIYKTKGE